MTLVSPDNIELNAEITSAGVNTPVNQLASVINGQIDSTNISSVSGAKLNAGTVAASALDANANPETRTSESLGNFVADGLIWSAVSGLNGTMTAGVAYIAGKRLAVSTVASHSFTASRDTYVYLDATGTIQYDPRTNGAAQPSTPDNTVLIAKVVSNASTLTSAITDLRKLSVGYDTNWIDLALPSGATGLHRYRRIGNLVHLEISLTNISVANNADISLTAMPAGVRPNTLCPPSVLFNGSGLGVGYILPSNGSTVLTNRSGTTKSGVDAQARYFIA